MYNEGYNVAIATFIAGAYTGTYNSVALGITEEGYDLQWEPKSQVIEKSDVYGEMLLDMVYAGTNYFIQTEFMEYKAGPLSVVFPWSSGIGVQGVIGRLASALAFPLVLTSTAATTAAATPATLTASLAILAPGSNPHAQFVSRLRTLPVRMVLLPSDSGGAVIKSLTTT